MNGHESDYKFEHERATASMHFAVTFIDDD